uniref:RUN domain-containing protein n=1 Tax=Haemonchus placei TaxID=6290 RepID=A0A0N4W4G4_HAEPC
LGQEAVRDLPGAGQAWVIFTACLIDQMRAGFEESRASYHLFSKREEVLGCATKHLCKSVQLSEIELLSSALAN